MNFRESTHKSTWLFSPKKLEQLRSANLLRALAGSAAAAAASPQQVNHHESNGAALITVAEEQQLLQYYGSKIQVVAQQMRFPRKVALTAAAYFKRFYLSKSVLDAEPMRFMLTALYLACKAEESYIGAEDFCRTLQQEPNVVLQNEVAMLQGLHFDLVVHNPLWSLQGLFADFDAWRGDPSSGAADALRLLPSAVLRHAHSAAQAALNATALTDAALLYPPGLLALSAMQNGFQQQSVELQAYLQRAASKGALQNGDADGSAALTALQPTLASIDAFQQQGMQTISDLQVKEIDRKMKAHKKSRQKNKTGKTAS